MPDAPLTLPPEGLRSLGYEIVDRLVEHLEALEQEPPIRLGDPAQLRTAVAGCPDAPGDPREVFDELFAILADGQRATHPRFFARIGSPSNAVSALTDFAAAGLNVFAGSWTGGSGATSIELEVVDWLREWMGMPPGTEGIMVSGGSVGTLTALAAATNERLTAPRTEATAYTSEQAHASLARAWRVLGFTPEHLRVLPGDERHRLTAAA